MPEILFIVFGALVGAVVGAVITWMMVRQQRQNAYQHGEQAGAQERAVFSERLANAATKALNYLSKKSERMELVNQFYLTELRIYH